VAELTTRESRIADLAAIGFRNAQIADRLGIPSTVVWSDLAEIYRKLRVASRAELNEARRARPDAPSSSS
jgi:DNA-binding CsgD family transcriptional regulator